MNHILGQSFHERISIDDRVRNMEIHGLLFFETRVWNSK